MKSWSSPRDRKNQDRLDLSYIERALFASRLEQRSFQRDVICVALSIDKTEVSRMISVATALPGRTDPGDRAGSEHGTPKVDGPRQGRRANRMVD